MNEMLAGFVPQTGFIDELHVQLAVEALAIDDVAEAVEDLESVVQGPLADAARRALKALDGQQVQEATELQIAALSTEPHEDAEPHGH